MEEIWKRFETNFSFFVAAVKEKENTSNRNLSISGLDHHTNLDYVFN